MVARKVSFALRKGYFRCRQKGVALIIFAFLLGLTVTSLGIKFISGSGFRIQQSSKNIQALAEAKATVIGYVVSGQSGAGVGIFPCYEDYTKIGFSTEGDAASSCSTTNIGRIAWHTIGAGDLVDGNNDKLWYALSAGFRAVPINSDTPAQLSIDGVQNQAVALLFSPGIMLSGQTRPTPTSSSAPSITNYLETENSDGDQDFITGASTATFNDNMLAIKADDIFPILEKRVLGEFTNYLKAYKAVWGAFPFPAAFGNPNLATYVGNSASTGGFLPISNTSPTTTWNTATAPVPIVVAPPGNVVSAPACSFRTSNTRIRCDITISSYNSINPPTVSISGIVNNIGLGFYNGLNVTNASDIQITTRSGSSIVVTASRLIVHSLDSTGKGIVKFSGTLANTGIVRIEYRRTPPMSNWVLAATNHFLLGGSAGNNWHHLIYYKVATPFLPGGNANCGVSCLSINTINVTPNATVTGSHALLVASGRKLVATDARPAPTYGVSNPAQVRPGSLLVDYFDSANNVSGGLTFDSTSRPLATFNDQVKVVE